MDALIVLTTLPATADAAGFSRSLVEQRLAACVNVLPPMQSTYRWEGGVEQEAERQVMIKTWRDRIDALEARVKALHPYAVPEWLVLEAQSGSEAYLGWMRTETR
jgi:periplasmic divalent cation tolerance protein